MIKKNIFLVVLLGIILGILSWYYYSHVYKDSLSSPGYDIESADFFGISANGKAYNLKATYVTKITKHKYKLIKTYSKYYLDEDKEDYTEVTSPTGFFNESKNLLDLNGGVEFILSRGYRMLTDNFSIDMNENIGTTKDEVLVSGDQGKVFSKNGMTVYMKKKKIIFHGPIKSMFIENEVTKQ